MHKIQFLAFALVLTSSATVFADPVAKTVVTKIKAVECNGNGQCAIRINLGTSDSCNNDRVYIDSSVPSTTVRMLVAIALMANMSNRNTIVTYVKDDKAPGYADGYCWIRNGSAHGIALE